MDTFYHLSNKSDKDESLKLNLDDLYEKKQQHNLFTVSSYNKILTRIHNKIKYTSRQYNDIHHCWYIIPEIMIGIPKYDHKDCTAYIIDKLQNNGFIIKYTYPNLLFISWNHWVPLYVRNEIKKKTGVIIDGYGKEVKNNSDSTEKNNYQDNNSLLFNDNKSNIKNNKESNYKNINNYKPEGKLLYKNDDFKNLIIK